MLKWIKSLLPENTAVSSENEVQTLKLELAERDQLIVKLKADLERQRQQADTQGAESIQMQLEQLFAEAATPVSQLQTQAHLLEAENRPIQARDVLTIARRLIRVLEDHGLSLMQHVGEQVSFDPNLHEPLAGVPPRPGQPVVVRFMGVAFHGKLIRKSSVEPIGEL